MDEGAIRSGVQERLSMARSRLSARGIGCLIVHGQGIIGGYGFYTSLSGRFPNVKGQYLLVPAEGPLIEVCATSEEAEIALHFGPGEIEVLRSDEPGLFPSFVGRSASRLASEAGMPSVGLSAPGPAAPGWRDHVAITAETGPLVDCDVMIAEVRAAPVPVDIDGLRETVGILERGIDAFAIHARPGMSEWEVSGLIENEMRRDGILTSLVFVSGGPYMGQLPQARSIRADDVVTVMVEAASRHGYWAEIGAVFVGPEVPTKVRDELQVWLEVAAECESFMSAGSRTGQVASMLVGRLSTVAEADPFGLGHGVGIDEGGPAIRLDSDDTLRAGTAISLHPSLADTDRSLRIAVANTLHITDEGPPMPLSTASHHLRAFS